MLRFLRSIGLLAYMALLPTFMGCAMCCGTDDYNYAAYGGKWQRENMSHGRVGSNLGNTSLGEHLQKFEPTLVDPKMESYELTEPELVAPPMSEMEPFDPSDLPPPSSDLTE